MPFTAWKHEERNRHKYRQMYLLKLQGRGAIVGKTGKTAVLPYFCKIERGGASGGCVIALRNNSFIGSKYHSLEPT